jgi:hypothetical protein
MAQLIAARGYHHCVPKVKHNERGELALSMLGHQMADANVAVFVTRRLVTELRL